MSTEQIPAQTVETADPLPSKKSWRPYIPGLASWIVGIFLLLVLGFMALPTFGGGCVRGPQTMALARAKQIGLALKVFAGDHDGEYPRAGFPGMPAGEIKDSNAAFAMVFPQYLTNETIFGNKQSAYQTRQPDNVYDPAYTGRPVKTLEPGENVYAYVAGLNDAAPADAPLVADGTDGTGHYTTEAKKRGGLWEGKKAILIRLDNSGSVETLAGPEHARYIRRRTVNAQPEEGNALDVSGLGPDVRLLDPAIDPRQP